MLRHSLVGLMAIAIGCSSETHPLSDTTNATTIVPADRQTVWNPGLNAIGGIPNRTTIFRTVSPRGGTLDDTAAIQSAVDGCPAGQVVQLTAGVFNINGGGLGFRNTDCTLRGMGPGTGGTGGNLANDGQTRFVAPAGATVLLKADRQTNPSFANLYVNPGNIDFGVSINLASDAVLNTSSLTLVSNPGIQVGEIVLVDENTDNNPDVYWGPAHDPPGGWFAQMV